MIVRLPRAWAIAGRGSPFQGSSDLCARAYPPDNLRFVRSSPERTGGSLCVGSFLAIELRLIKLVWERATHRDVFILFLCEPRDDTSRLPRTDCGAGIFDIRPRPNLDRRRHRLEYGRELVTGRRAELDDGGGAELYGQRRFLRSPPHVQRLGGLPFVQQPDVELLPHVERLA